MWFEHEFFWLDQNWDEVILHRVRSACVFDVQPLIRFE